MSSESQHNPEQPPASLTQRTWLLLRGCGPLALVAALVLAGPTLLIWWLLKDAFGWPHLLLGLGISLGLVIGGGLALGWAMGRIKRAPRH